MPKSSAATEHYRAFLALELPPVVRGVVREAQARLKPTTGVVRWVDPENFHVTLKFLGDVEPARLEELVSRLTARLASFGPTPVAVHGVGAFPGVKRPRVVWAGLADPAPVQRLAAMVEAAAEDCGFVPESRPFHGHVTLGRVKRPGDLPERLLNSDWREIHSETVFLRQVTLFRSHLDRSGAVYSALNQVQLD